MKALEITLKFTPPESETILAAAREEDQVVSHWAKEAILHLAHTSNGLDSKRLVLTELKYPETRVHGLHLLQYLLEKYRMDDPTGAERLECRYSVVLDQLQSGALRDWDHAESLVDALLERTE